MMFGDPWVANIIQVTCCLMVYLFFVWIIFKNQFKYNPIASKLALTGYALFSIILICLFFAKASPFSAHKALGIIIWLAASILISRLLLRSNLAQLLCFIFMAFNIQFQVILVAKSILKMDIIPHISLNAEVQYLFITIISMLLFLPAIWYLFGKLFKQVISINIDQDSWRYIFIIPLAAFLCSFFSSINAAQFARKSLELTLATTISFAIFTLLAYGVVLRMLLTTQKSINATENAANTRQQLLIQSEQYKRLTDNINQTERLRHDMRHHLIALKGYLDAGELESASNYLESFMGKILPNNDPPICEKQSVDILVRHYLALARQSGVEVQAIVNLPQDFAMDDTDLCIIFGNLIENAVDSCLRQQTGKRFIEVRTKPINSNVLVLKVTNSFAGELLQCEDRFISQKHAGLGIGINSVQNTVQKNGGTCKFSYQDHVFEASVLLVH